MICYADGAVEETAEAAVDIQSFPHGFKSKVRNKVIFGDVIIWTFVFKDSAISNQVP